MPLSNAEAAKLKRRRAKAKKLKDQIEAIVQQAGAQTKLPYLQAELNATLADIAGLEAKQKVLAEATALAKAQALTAVDEIAAEAVASIGSVYGASAAAVDGKFALLNQALFIQDVQDLMSLAAQKRDATILQAMRQTAAKAELLNRELMVRTFGPEAVGNRAKGLGLFLGGGIDLQVVEDVWKGMPDARKGKGLAWLLKAGDKADATQLTSTLKRLISLGEDSRRSYAALKAAGMPQAAMTKWADDLLAAAKGAIGAADPATRAAALKHFEAVRAKTRKYLEARKVGPLGTRGAGKKLIADLNKAVKTLDGDAAEAAAKTWIDQKSKYEATRAARSATNATYNEANTRAWMKNPAVYACRWVLSFAHPVQDICNACADADFGLGPGVYKLGDYPIEHPQGLCRLEPVIDKDYLKTGVQKGWFPPGDYATAVRALDFDGPLRNTTRRKGAEIPTLLEEANLLRPPVKPLRSEFVSQNGVILSKKAWEAEQSALKAAWAASPEGQAALHSRKVKAGMAKKKAAAEGAEVAAADAKKVADAIAAGKAYPEGFVVGKDYRKPGSYVGPGGKTMQSKAAWQLKDGPHGTGIIPWKTGADDVRKEVEAGWAAFKKELDPDTFKAYQKAIQKAEMRQVPLDDLITFQRTVTRSQVDAVIDLDLAKLGDEALVLKHNGKTYLYDGNHRATAALLRGDTHVPAHFLDLDAVAAQRAAKEAAEAAAKKAAAEKAAKEAAEKAAAEKAAKEAAEKAAKEAAEKKAKLEAKQKLLVETEEKIAQMPPGPALQSAINLQQKFITQGLKEGLDPDALHAALQAAKAKGEKLAAEKAAKEAAEKAAKEAAEKLAAEKAAKETLAKQIGTDVKSIDAALAKGMTLDDFKAMAQAKLEQEAAEKAAAQAAKEAAEKAAKEAAEKEAAEKAAKDGIKDTGLKSQLDEVHYQQQTLWDDIASGSGSLDDDEALDWLIEQQQGYAQTLAEERKILEQLDDGPVKDALMGAHQAKVTKLIDEFGMPDDMVEDLLQEAAEEGLQLKAEKEALKAAKAGTPAPAPAKATLTHGEKVQLGMAKKKAAAQKAKLETLTPGTTAYQKAEKAYNAAVAKAKALGASDADLLGATAALAAEKETTEAIAKATVKPFKHGTTPPFKLEEMKEIPMRLGGAHPKSVYQAPDGSKWLVKPAYVGDDFMATAEVAAARIANKLDIASAETYVVRLPDGRAASMQKLVPNASSGLVPDKHAAGAWMDALTPSEVRHIQREHILDWIISNHDSHLENFVRAPDIEVLMGIDKGQSFRFWGKDKLNPIGYKPNPSRSVYDMLYEAARDGKKIPGLSLDPADFKDMWTGLRKLADDPEAIALLREYATQRIAKHGPKPGFRTADEFIAAWRSRVLSAEADFQKFYGELAERLGIPKGAARELVATGKARGLAGKWGAEYEKIMALVEDELAKAGGASRVFMDFTTNGHSTFVSGNKKASELAERVAQRLGLQKTQWNGVKSAVRSWSGCSTSAGGKKFMQAINKLQGFDNDFWGMSGAAAATIHDDYCRGLLLKRAMTARYIRHHKPDGWRMHRGWGGGPSTGGKFVEQVRATHGGAPIKRVQSRTAPDLKFRPAASWTFEGNSTSFGSFRSSAWVDEHDDFWTAVWVDSDLDRYAGESEIIMGRLEGREVTWRMGAHGNVKEVGIHGASSPGAAVGGGPPPIASTSGWGGPTTVGNPYAKYDKYATPTGDLNTSAKFKAHMTPTGAVKTVTIEGTKKSVTVPVVAKFSKKHKTFVWWHPAEGKKAGFWVKQGVGGKEVKVIGPWPNAKTGV